MATEEEHKPEEVVSIELPAPAGWIKKFTPRKGGTPQRNDIVFISPTGEEIKNKRQLDQYLKSHPGGPPASEFDWGTGDTPRRSARLSEKSKAAEAPASQSPKKKQKKSSTKGAKDKTDADGEGKATDEKNSAAKETKESEEVPIVNAKDAGGGEVVTEGEPEKPNVEELEKKSEAKPVLEEPSIVETSHVASAENPNSNTEQSNDATNVVADAKIEESNDATNVVADAKIEESSDATNVVADAKIDESKEAANDVPDAKIDEFKVAANDVPDAKIDEFKEAASDVLRAKNEEPKDTCNAEKETSETCNAGKETSDGKLDNAETVVTDQDNSKEKQAAEKSIELQETTTGS